MRSDSFIVTVDKDDNPHLIDSMELSKYSFKATVDVDGSKQIVDESLTCILTMLLQFKQLR